MTINYVSRRAGKLSVPDLNPRHVVLRWSQQAKSKLRIAQLFGAAALLFSASCGNLADTSNRDFNSGLAEGQASTILANIVRSAKGYPTYFTVAGDFQQNQQVQVAPSIFYDPGISGGATDLNFSLAPSGSQSSSATASSLETSEFTEAMHTAIAPELVVKLAESRDEAHLHLALMLLLQRVTIRQSDYQSIVSAAQATCGSNSGDLPATQRGICQGFYLERVSNNCAAIGSSSRSGLVTLTNDPTSLCQFERFRTLVESIAILQPRLAFTEPSSGSRDSSGTLVYLGDSAAPTRRLFSQNGTGYRLRSPSQIVFYLGQIVNETYSGVDQARLSITSVDGSLAPIFDVETGQGNSSVSAIVDGERYWLKPQQLGSATNDYSHRSLTLVKDLIALNTLQTQLPQSPAIFLGPG